MIKILAFGYIPKGKGGKQLTGLATGLFDLHNSVNSLEENYKIVIAATDINSKKIMIDNTIVIGWTKRLLILHVLTHPIRGLLLFFKSIKLLKFYRLISYFNSLIKIIFLDYSILQIKPQIVHFHGTYGALLSECILNRNQTCVLRLHGINGQDNSIKNYKEHKLAEEYITSLKFKFVTFVSNSISEEWKNLYGNFICPMVPVLNGYNPQIFNALNYESLPNKFDLISIGGVSERKGQQRIIEALILLKKENIYLSYINIGHISKPDKQIINDIIAENQLDVQMLDFISQDEIVRYLNQSLFFILPSMSEGFGKVFIESIACGVPVIIPKQLPLAKEKGVLSEANAIFMNDSTANSIYQVLKELSFLKLNFESPMVSKSVEELTWSKLAKKYLQLYQNIC